MADDCSPSERLRARVRTLAFYFSSESAANEAASVLREHARPAADAIDTAPLSVEGTDGTLLALTIEDELHSETIRTGSELGGRLVADVPEEWTHPRSGPP